MCLDGLTVSTRSDIKICKVKFRLLHLILLSGDKGTVIRTVWPFSAKCLNQALPTLD